MCARTLTRKGTYHMQGTCMYKRIYLDFSLQVLMCFFTKHQKKTQSLMYASLTNITFNVVCNAGKQ